MKIENLYDKSKKFLLKRENAETRTFTKLNA